MLKITPDDIATLVNVANCLDDNGDFEDSNEVTKIAQNMLFLLSEPNQEEKEQMIEEIITEIK